MAFQKKDFIEIEFTAKTAEDKQIFDSNIKEKLQEIDPKIRPEKAKPLIIALGQGMFLSGVEEELMKKGKPKEKITVELPAERAFGKRQSKLIERFPLKIFREHNVNPTPGYMFNFDGRIGKVLASSGGRVIVDFNNPIAGRDVIYEVKILRKVENLKEKIKALNQFLFRKDLDFEVDEKNKKILFDLEGNLKKFVGAFSGKYKELLGFEIGFKENKENSKSPERNTKKSQ